MDWWVSYYCHLGMYCKYFKVGCYMYCNARVFHFDPSESVPMRMLDESWNEFIIGVCQGKPRSPNQGATNCVKLDRIFARYVEKCMTIVQLEFFRERDVRSEILQVFCLQSGF